MLKAVFKLPYRALEGFLTSICQLMKIDLDVPDHTIFSRRSQTLEINELSQLNTQKPINIVADSSGLKIFGLGEW